jgi:hypothetical protein
MTEDVWIVVPVGKREKYLEGILESTSAYHGRLVFVNNSPEYTRYSGVNHLEDFSDVNIYRWWNSGIRYAKERGAKYVVVLNDDLKFDDRYVPSIIDFLVTGSYAIVDTDNSGNNGGAAWALDLGYNLWLNEGFKWWYGDTEIFDRARKMGKFAKFSYANFAHLEPNGSMGQNPEISRLVEDDRRLYEETSK